MAPGASSASISGTDVPRLGAHMSIARRAAARGGSRGAARLRGAADLHEVRGPVARAAAARRGGGRVPPARRGDAGIRPVVAHASYLINLAARDDALRRQSMDALDRGDSTGPRRSASTASCCTPARAPAAPTTTASTWSRKSCARCSPGGRAAGARVLLEHTAGQGTTLGRTLRAARAHHRGRRRLAPRRRVARHVPPARRRLRHRERARATATRSGSSADSSASIACTAFHVNDSKKPLGSRVDRHEHIGEGAHRARDVPRGC